MAAPPPAVGGVAVAGGASGASNFKFVALDQAGCCLPRMFTQTKKKAKALEKHPPSKKNGPLISMNHDIQNRLQKKRGLETGKALRLHFGNLDMATSKCHLYALFLADPFSDQKQDGTW